MPFPCTRAHDNARGSHEAAWQPIGCCDGCVAAAKHDGRVVGAVLFGGVSAAVELNDYTYCRCDMSDVRIDGRTSKIGHIMPILRPSMRIWTPI